MISGPKIRAAVVYCSVRCLYDHACTPGANTTNAAAITNEVNSALLRRIDCGKVISRFISSSLKTKHPKNGSAVNLKIRIADEFVFIIGKRSNAICTVDGEADRRSFRKSSLMPRACFLRSERFR
jgi:hypothetical protein